MMGFRDFIYEGRTRPSEKKTLTMVAKDKEIRKRKAVEDITAADFRESHDLAEIAIKPKTARILSLAVLARILGRKKAVITATDTNEKLNNLAELVADSAYLSLINIAIDQNDFTIIRKVPRK